MKKNENYTGPLKEARYKNIILKHIRNDRDTYTFCFILHKTLSLENITLAAFINLIEEISLDGLIETRLNSTGDLFIIVSKTSKIDFFLEQGGYETQYLTEQSEVSAENAKFRQENFIRFVKVIKSGAWLLVFAISVLVNIYFIWRLLLPYLI